MKIKIPSKETWPEFALEMEKLIVAGCNEYDMQKYLKDNRWILLVMFGENEGVCFTEYEVEAGERSDFFVVAGGSFPDATFIELKSPQAKLFNDDNRKMSSSLNEAMTKTLNKMFMVNSNYDYHYELLGRQLDELSRGIKNWYQGVYTNELGRRFEIPFEKFITYHAAIVLGRDGEIQRNDRFREGVSRFLGGIKLYTYDSILRKLRAYSE